MQELSEKDRAEINRLIAEAVGYTEIKECEGKLLGWKPDTPQPLPERRDIVFVGRYRKILPDYCGDDAAAWMALKLLLPKGIDFMMMSAGTLEAPIIRIRLVPTKQSEPIRDTNGDGKGDNPLAAALKDAMVEQTDEDLIGQRPDILHKTEKVWRLKPALEAVLKEK